MIHLGGINGSPWFAWFTLQLLKPKPKWSKEIHSQRSSSWWVSLFYCLLISGFSFFVLSSLDNVRVGLHFIIHLRSNKFQDPFFIKCQIFFMFFPFLERCFERTKRINRNCFEGPKGVNCSWHQDRLGWLPPIMFLVYKKSWPRELENHTNPNGSNPNRPLCGFCYDNAGLWGNRAILPSSISGGHWYDGRKESSTASGHFWEQQCVAVCGCAVV